MKYYGTRNPEQLYSMAEAAVLGLAPCGGLFMPETIPTISMEQVLRRASVSFPEMALYVAEQFFGPEDIPSEHLREIVYDAFDFPIELSSTGALELFHGPTLAFKDFGARFMGRMLSYLRTRDMIILTATSGDTGSAVANGFYGIDGVRVLVLYPEGRVSDFQERQMTTLGGNITALSVRGSFDDCQRMVKEIFRDIDFCREHGVTSANSISILRWIPQSFYYFYGYYLWLQQGGRGEAVVSVPSGNFGNITAGMLAKRMGLPISRFVAATNANDTMVRFLATGKYEARDSVQTISNAMDVGDPSNYERLVALYGNAEEAMSDFQAHSFTDEQTRTAIRHLYQESGYVSDPHSAIGWLASEGLKSGFYIATAHPSKFESVIADTLDIQTQYPEHMKRFFEAPKVFRSIPPSTAELIAEITTHDTI